MKKKNEVGFRELSVTPRSQTVLRGVDIREISQSPCLFQPRAQKALDLGLAISGPEHNIFVSGEPGLGRTYLVEGALRPYARNVETPPDLIYLNNFKNPDVPVLVSLSAGQGKLFRESVQRAVKRLRKDLPRHFEQSSYLRLQNKLFTKLSIIRDDIVGRMEDVATKKGFSLSIEDSGAITLTPLVEGKVLTPEEYDRLDSTRKKGIKDQSGVVLNTIAELSRLVSKHEQDFQTQEFELAQEHAANLVERVLAPVRKKFGEVKGLRGFFEELRDDILENFEQFQGKPDPGQRSSADSQSEQSGDSFFQRYDVNVFVDNSQCEGAPILVEINPSFFNLLGCVERETEWGTYYTDFSLIKAGAIHRANGGFLVLRVEDILAHPAAWDGLLRCLRTQQSNFEEPSDHYDLLRTRTISPQPINISLKVVLIGDDDTYELLYVHDERFRKLFKVKAHIQETADRTIDNIRNYASVLVKISKESMLRNFTKDAYAMLVDYSTRIAEDRTMLSLRFSQIRELMIEANAIAKLDGSKNVTEEILKKALEEKEHRGNLYKEEFLREYDKKLIKVKTQGEAVGVTNGLSVTQIGEYVMGLPHQISCTVGVGHGGIMDLEREAELGGPIHTKGMMILKSYIVNLFAQDKPIVLTGSLCFEQSYAQVDGDSASGAELVALLSALSGVPVGLRYAFTGAISQSGAIMAVGGVTHKVEGFFEVCRRRGLTGQQGVLLPADNVSHLVLHGDVLDAIRAGMFHVYPVHTIEEALEILTGERAGQRLKNGAFSPGSIYARADARLAELAALAEKKVVFRKRKGSLGAKARQ